MATFLPEELAAIVLESKETSAGLPDNGSVHIDRLYEILDRVLRDLESNETALQIALTALPHEISDDDGLLPVSKHVKFVKAERICRIMSNAFAKTQKPQCAAVLARQALELAPDNATNYAMVGELHLSQRNWADAESAYRRAVALEPENAAAHAKLSFCLSKLGRAGEAADIGSRALQLLSPQRHESGAGSEQRING